ncbi:hypothetical protein Dimus_029433 [Dionaea muscipula]
MYQNGLCTRSFSKKDKRKLGVWAFLSCVLMVITFYALLKAYMGPLHTCKFHDHQHTRAPKAIYVVYHHHHHYSLIYFCIQIIDHDQLSDKFIFGLPVTLGFSRNVNVVMVSGITNNNETRDLRSSREPAEIAVKLAEPNKFNPLSMQICNFSEPRSDFCTINGDVRIQGNSSTIFIASPSPFGDGSAREDTRWIGIRPYARKGDETAMARTRKFSLRPSAASPGRELTPNCTKNHSVAGVIFSSGGYAGNHFHDFSDVIIPLYITSRHLNRKVELLVANMKPWWLAKFRVILKALSMYNIIDIDKDREIHCFPSMIVGLRASNKELGIDPLTSSPDGNSYTMRNFTCFLRNAYSLKRDTATKLIVGDERKPRLLIILRKSSRVLLNKDEIAAEARSLGYDVVAAEARENLQEFAKMVNSADVMVGVHGAGITNFVFLPERAILIQVVPLGLEWLSKYDFELPAEDMNLRYLEYNIDANESSLLEQYPVNHPVLRSPSSVLEKQGWRAFKSVYLDKQNVRLDVSRFRLTLLKAHDLLHDR